MRVHLAALGCRLNEAELEQWSREFIARGHQISPSPAESDLLVVNTCAVTGEAVRKSRKLLSRAHRDNPHAKLVVSGCYGTLDPRGAAAIDGVDLVIPNERKDDLVAETERRLDLHTMPVTAMEGEAAGLLERGRQRAFIKIQDGCRYQCTFCIVTAARGEERSRPITEIVAEINALHGEGVNEAVLTGVHLGGYGDDIGGDLGELIQAILRDTDIPRLRLGALEPWDLPAGFWERFADPRLMPHLHLPLQSGSDEILRRMARRCKTAEFTRLVEQARAAVDGFNITTDIIVGFPGESDDHWRRTMDYVEATGFGHLHIFAYSRREGTLAADLPNPVDEATIRRRSAELHALGRRLKREELQRQIGAEGEVLLEKPLSDDAQRWTGYTPNYHRVAFTLAASEGEPGRIHPVRIRGVDEEREQLLGEKSTPENARAHHGTPRWGS